MNLLKELIAHINEGITDSNGRYRRPREGSLLSRRNVLAAVMDELGKKFPNDRFDDFRAALGKNEQLTPEQIKKACEYAGVDIELVSSIIDIEL